MFPTDPATGTGKVGSQGLVGTVRTGHAVTWRVPRYRFLYGASPPPPVVPFLEHDLVARVQHPVVALAVLSSLDGELHEALVQGEVVPNRVLPALVLSFAVVGKVIRDEVVYSIQGEPLLLRALDGHGDECDVRVGGLHIRCLRVAAFLRGIAGLQPDHSSRDGWHWLWRDLLAVHRHGPLHRHPELAFVDDRTVAAAAASIMAVHVGRSVASNLGRTGTAVPRTYDVRNGHHVLELRTAQRS